MSFKSFVTKYTQNIVRSLTSTSNVFIQKTIQPELLSSVVQVKDGGVTCIAVDGKTYKFINLGDDAENAVSAVRVGDTFISPMAEKNPAYDDTFGEGLFMLADGIGNYYVQKVGKDPLYQFDPYIISGFPLLAPPNFDFIGFSPNGKHIFCAGHVDDISVPNANTCTLYFGYILNFGLVGSSVTGAATQGVKVLTSPDSVSAPAPPGSFSTSFTQTQVGSGNPNFCHNGACPGGSSSSTVTIGGQNDYTSMPNQAVWNQPTSFFNIQDHAWILYDTLGGLEADWAGIYAAEGLNRTFMDITVQSQPSSQISATCFCCNGPHCLGGFATYTCTTTFSDIHTASGITGPPLPIVSRTYTDTHQLINGGNGIIPNPCPPADTDCAGPITCSINSSSSSSTSITNFAGAIQWNNGQTPGSAGGTLPIMSNFHFSTNADIVTGMMSVVGIISGGSVSSARFITSQFRTTFVPTSTSTAPGPGITVNTSFITVHTATTVSATLRIQQLGFSRLKGYRGKTGPGALLVVCNTPSSLHRFLSPYTSDDTAVETGPLFFVTAFDDVNTYITFPGDPAITDAKSLSQTVVETILFDGPMVNLARWNKNTFTSIFSKSISLTVPVPSIAILDYSTKAGV